MPAVFLFATLDTKGREAAFVRDLLTAWGVSVTLVDVGALGAPAVAADVPRERIFELAETSADAVRKKGDRGEAVTHAAEGAARLAREAHARGELAGVLALGGSAGTTIGTAAMKALPLGVPKVMVSTLASGMVGSSSGTKISSCSTPSSTSPGSTASAGRCSRRRRARWLGSWRVPGRRRSRPTDRSWRRRCSG